MSYTFTQTGPEIQDILDRAEQGGAIDQALAAKQDALTFDAVPTEGSTNPAESGGIYDAIQAGGATALAAFATDTVSGDVVSFTDGADNIPVKSFVGSIVPVQSGSGDPAPDNVRPISGWTGANVYRGGANLSPAKATATTVNGITCTPQADGSMRVAGTASARANITCFQGFTGDGNPVTIYAPDYYPTAACGWFIWDSTDSATVLARAESRIGYQFATTSGHVYSLALVIDAGTVIDTTVYPVVTPSADYATILLSFGSTVYAGTITALGGGRWQIQATHAIVDLGTLSYNYRSAKNCFDATVTGMVDGVGGVVADIKCSTYPAVASLAYSNWQNAQDKSIFASSSESSKIVIRDTAYTSEADFVAAVTGQTLLYPLATLPDPIIVDAEDLQTILGANTVWLDCGSVTEMEYRADTALYIQKLINGGTVSTLSTASPTPTLTLDRPDTLTLGDFVSFPSASEPDVVTDEPAEEQADEPTITEDAEPDLAPIEEEGAEE